MKSYILSLNDNDIAHFAFEIWSYLINAVVGIT